MRGVELFETKEVIGIAQGIYEDILKQEKGDKETKWLIGDERKANMERCIIKKNEC